MSLSGSDEGIELIHSNKELWVAVLGLLDEKMDILKSTLLTLVNLTTNDKVSFTLLSYNDGTLFNKLGLYVLQPNSIFADIACGILNNISRSEKCAHKMVKLISEDTKRSEEDKETQE